MSEMANAAPALEITDLRKTYRGTKKSPAKEALKGINLTVPRGSFFGLLGPNGAGKSTLINIIAGLVNKTGGTARICGYDINSEPRAARLSVGVVPQELNLDAFFTPRELVEFQGGLYGLPKAARRTDEILAAMGLSDKADAYARTLSGGMRRRLLVAKALVHSPDVLILDEPTAGVDIELRQQLWKYIKKLNADGTTIILTTHYLEEAEALCDQIAIINHGALVACEPTAQLLGKLDMKRLNVMVGEEIGDIPPELEKFNAVLLDSRRLGFQYKPSETEIRDILRAIANLGLTIQDLTTEEPDLEDAFLQITKAS